MDDSLNTVFPHRKMAPLAYTNDYMKLSNVGPLAREIYISDDELILTNQLVAINE